ncbi:rhomboid domain-containing protein 2 [Pholidichthys leucotaenia]
MIFKAIKDVAPSLTSGILIVVFVSCVIFGVQMYFGFTPGVFSIGSSVFLNGQPHRILTYPFYHRTFAQLLLNIAALVLLSSSLEKGVGTVRFLFQFLLLSSFTGLFYSFLDLLQEEGMGAHTEGLVPVTLACVAVTTMHTKMTRSFLFGVSFPTIALPWVLLIITTALVPNCMLPCNIIAVLIGWVHGRGWLSLVDMSEARAGVLEKVMPFRVLRSFSGPMFVPASTEDRRKTLLPQINPTPGSYPVQAYAPQLFSANTATMVYEGWPNSKGAQTDPTPPPSLHGHVSAHGVGSSVGHSLEQSFGQSCNHSHGHGHSHGQQ